MFQNSVLSPEITKESMDMTSKFAKLEDTVEDGIDLMNKNGGFTVIGWYKCGQVNNCTVLIQNSSENTSKYSSTNNEPSKVDNSELKIHPCVICPSNKNFFNKQSYEGDLMERNKYDVKELTSNA